MPLQQRLALALRYHQQGEIPAAVAHYRGILADVPDCSDAVHLLGVARVTQGAVDEGIDWIRKAIALDPSQPGFHFSLAQALLGRGAPSAALGSLERVIALRPDHVEAWFYRGNALLRSGQATAAADSYRRAIALRPAYPQAHSNLAAVLRELRQLPAALVQADLALRYLPGYAGALNNRGLVLLDLGRLADAAEQFRQAIAIQADFSEALHNLATAQMGMALYAEARETLRRLLRTDPGFRHATGNLVYAMMSQCDWSDLDEAHTRLIAAVAAGRHADRPMSFLFISGSAALQLRCARTYVDAYFPAQPVRATPRRPMPERIRVAYHSGDFGEHAVSYLLSGVIEHHDRSRFETIGLSWGRQSDGEYRRRIERGFCQFHDVSDVGDAAIVALLQRLEVDIAVDLMGHTLGQRTAILACRPAPIQVNYLGLPATMGAPYMDYLIADRHLVPQERFQDYAENVVWLPDTFQPNDNRRVLDLSPLPRAAYGLPERGLVLCVFNQAAKLNPRCFDAWMRLLAATPDSVLWLLANDAPTRQNLQREAGRRGIDPGRLVFAPRVAYADYLRRYVHADLFLDTTPCNGGATVSDAVSMGVPVLTCMGESFAGRMAGSLLTSLGLTALVTTSLAEYEARGGELLRNPGTLQALRQQIIALRASHPVFATDRYRLNLEAAYRMMAARAAAGQHPAHVAVPSADSRP